MTLGERVGASRNYNGRWSIPGLAGDHFCGERSAFEEGQPWPYTGPDIEYGPDNIPLCCPRQLLLEVTAGAAVTLAEPVGYTRAPTAGAAVDYIHAPPPPVTVTAGASVDSGIGTPGPHAGASVDSGIGTPGPHAGAAVDYIHGPPPPVTVTAGASVDSGIGTPGPHAGAAVDYTTPPPHSTCATALDLGEGGTFSLDFPAGPAERWVRWFPPLIDVAWHVETDLPGFAGITVIPYQGDDCSSLGEKIVLITSLVCVSFFLDESLEAFIKFVSDLDAPRTQLFTVDAGDC